MSLMLARWLIFWGLMTHLKDPSTYMLGNNKKFVYSLNCYDGNLMTYLAVPYTGMLFSKETFGLSLH